MSLPLEQLKFDASGLITAVVQDGLTGEVRMVAWMDPAALAATLATRRATFFSRSRQRLWVKGEESGNFLQVTDVLADCDGDTLLVLCEPLGPSCHTGQDNCFFRPLEASPSDAKSDKSEPARPLMGRLEAVLELRRRSPAEKSYTRSLLDGGAEKVGAKLLEEAGELGVALAAESDERVASEAADVLYHLLVGLRLRQVAWRDVLAVIGARFGVGGHAEKASRLGPG